MSKYEFTYKDMMKLRSAYSSGYRTKETKAAAAQYVDLRRKNKLDEFKAAQCVEKVEILDMVDVSPRCEVRNG